MDFVVADWDKATHWNVYPGTGRIKNFTREAFLHGDAFAVFSNTMFVIEAPHMQERRKRSVAQIYTRAELEILAKNAENFGVTLMCFAAKQTVRASEEAGNGEYRLIMDGGKERRKWFPDKAKDSKSIHFFVQVHPEIPLMRWRLPTDEDLNVFERRDDMRSDMSNRLNEMRPLYESPEVDRARQFAKAVFDSLDPNTIKWFGMKKVYAGKPKERVDFKETRLMSVWVAVFSEDGTLRRNDGGGFIGVREVMATLWMHPFHGRGGTARSNLILHMLSKTEVRKTGRKPEVRRSFARAIKRMVKALRDYGIAIEN